MCLPYYYCNEQTKTEAGDIEGHYSSFIVQNCVEKNANRSNKTKAKKLRLNKKTTSKQPFKAKAIYSDSTTRAGFAMNSYLEKRT